MNSHKHPTEAHNKRDKKEGRVRMIEMGGNEGMVSVWKCCSYDGISRESHGKRIETGEIYAGEMIEVIVGGEENKERVC